MFTALVCLSLSGLALFYLQLLVLFPHVRLLPLSLLLLYAGARFPLRLGLVLALILSLLQDSYATTPFGFHLVGSLIIIGTGYFARRRFLLQHPGSQIVVSIIAMSLQESGLRLILAVLSFQAIISEGLFLTRGLEIFFSGLLAPLVFALMPEWEKLWGHTATRRTASPTF
jgi:rod shape-determining protein MreD